MFTEDQLQRIEQLWTLRKTPHPLELAQLAELSRIVFYASLRREEERPIEIRVTLLQRSDLSTRARFSPLVRFLPMNPEPEFTVDTVVKLAGALDTRNSALIVIQDEERYVVAGIAFFGWHASSLDADPASCPPPHGLTLVARQPGQLAIAHADIAIARFVDGQIVPVEPTPLVSSTLGSVFEQRIKSHPGFQKFPQSYRGAYVACLERLLVLAESRGHGGTILWVPADLIHTLANCVDIRRNFTSAPDMNESLEGMLSAAKDVHGVLEAHRANRPHWRPIDTMAIGPRAAQNKRRLNEHLALLAQLTRVDGALVIDEYLRPLGFSAVIKTTNEWQGPVVNMSKLTPGTVDMTKFGTRHRSAVTFAANCDGAVAIVISQDGAVRAMVRQSEKVLFWPDCFGSVFL